MENLDDLILNDNKNKQQNEQKDEKKDIQQSVSDEEIKNIIMLIHLAYNTTSDQDDKIIHFLPNVLYHCFSSKEFDYEDRLGCYYNVFLEHIKEQIYTNVKNKKEEEINELKDTIDMSDKTNKENYIKIEAKSNKLISKKFNIENMKEYIKNLTNEILQNANYQQEEQIDKNKQKIFQEKLKELETIIESMYFDMFFNNILPLYLEKAKIKNENYETFKIYNNLKKVNISEFAKKKIDNFYYCQLFNNKEWKDTINNNFDKIEEEPTINTEKFGEKILNTFFDHLNCNVMRLRDDAKTKHALYQCFIKPLTLEFNERTKQLTRVLLSDIDHSNNPTTCLQKIIQTSVDLQLMSDNVRKNYLSVDMGKIEDNIYDFINSLHGDANKFYYNDFDINKAKNIIGWRFFGCGKRTIPENNTADLKYFASDNNNSCFKNGYNNHFLFSNTTNAIQNLIKQNILTLKEKNESFLKMAMEDKKQEQQEIYDKNNLNGVVNKNNKKEFIEKDEFTNGMIINTCNNKLNPIINNNQNNNNLSLLAQRGLKNMDFKQNKNNKTKNNQQNKSNYQSNIEVKDNQNSNNRKSNNRTQRNDNYEFNNIAKKGMEVLNFNNNNQKKDNNNKKTIGLSFASLNKDDNLNPGTNTTNEALDRIFGKQDLTHQLASQLIKEANGNNKDIKKNNTNINRKDINNDNILTNKQDEVIDLENEIAFF